MKTKKAQLIVMASLMVIVSIVLIAVASWWARLRQLDYLRQVETNKQAAFAQNIGDSIKTDVTSTLSSLKLASQLVEIRNNDPASCLKKLRDLHDTVLPKLGNVGRINNKGNFSCSINNALVGRAGASLGSYIPEIFNDPAHKPVMSRAITAPGAPSLLVAIHVPVLNAKGDFDGTLGGAIYLADLKSRYLDNAKLSANSYAVVMDDDFTVISHPNTTSIGRKLTDPATNGMSKEDHDKILDAARKALAGDTQTIQYTASGGVQRISGLASVEVFPGRRWIIWVVAPASDINKVTNDPRTITIVLTLIISIIVLVALFGFLIIGYVIATILNPIRRVGIAAADIGKADFNRRVPYVGDDEVGQLAKSFNRMAGELKDYYSTLESRVKEKTAELAKIVSETEKKNKDLEKTKLAMLNVLDDLAVEKSRAEKNHLRDEAIVNSVGEGLIITNEYGNITTINPVAAETLGLKPEQVIGQWFNKVIIAVDEKEVPIDPFDRPINQALQTGKVVTSSKLYYKRVDGTTFPAFVAVSPIVLGGKPLGAVEVFRDITKERELEKAKEEFVSLASHQLRTPATGVKAFTSMLLDGYAGKLTPKQEEFLLKAVDSNERQLQIIDDMLNVARADSGRMVLAPEELEFTKLMESIVAEQKATIDGRKQTIDVQGVKGPINIMADPSKIRMVIENLISNASKYTPEGGKLTVKYAYDAKAGLTLSVADTGVGIDKKDLPKLFKKFSRIDNPLSTVVGGTGLGLYLAGKIVQLHNGKLTADSELGKGTTFTLQLPVSKKVPKSGKNPDS